MRKSRSVKKEVVTGKKLGGSDIYISELDGIVDLLASNNRPKWENGEEEERDGGERDVPKLFSVLLIFSTWKSNSRVFLRTHTHTHTRVFIMVGEKKNGNEIWLLEGSFCRAR